MRLASALVIAFGFLALACASNVDVSSTVAGDEARPAVTTSESQNGPPGMDLSRERQLVEEARAAARVVDLTTSRTKAGEAIDLLLARPESERDPGWLELVNAAGHAAWDAQDVHAAAAAWENVLEVRSRTLANDHPDLQRARGNFALTLETLGDLGAARVLREQVLEVSLRTLPDDHIDLQMARQGLANTLYSLGHFAAARTLREKVLDVLSRTLPDEHSDLQAARANYAITLKGLGDIAAARALEEKVLEVCLRTLSDDHPDTQKARQNLANTLETLGDFAAARALNEKILEVRSRTLPDDHLDLQAVRLNLANTLYLLGDLRAARALQEKVLEVSRTLPDDHPILQAARHNLAVTLYALGEVTEARDLQERALEAYSRTLPDDHPDLQAARGNLSGTLQTLGDLAAARALQEKVLEVSSRTLPDDHLDLQRARLSLANTLYALGDLVAARALQEKVLEVFSRTMQDDHPDLQLARGNLAVTLLTLGDLAAARALEEKVFEVCSYTLPDDHPDLQRARGNLAIMLDALGDHRAARALHEKVVEVFSRTLSDDHLDFQKARNNLANTLYALGDLSESRALMEKVLEVRSRRLPADHPELRMTWGNLALIIAAGRAAEKREQEGEKGENRNEFAYMARSFTRAITRSAQAAIVTASSREAEERCANSVADLGRALSFAEGMGVFESDARLQREVFALSEQTRGAALASAHLSRRASADPDYRRLRHAMRTASNELARLAQQGARADEIDHARSTREATELELAQLARTLSDEEVGILELDPASLSAMLSDREALVGYRRYPRMAYEPDGGLEPKTTDSLCAFVLRSGDRLERIELGPLEPIELAVRSFREAIGVGGGRGVGVGGAKPTSGHAVLTFGNDVRRLIFDPLLPVLEGTGRIVVALDDVLNIVPLDALPLGQSLLGERWRIETRCTLAELLWKSPVTSSDTLVAFGGVAFDSSPLPYMAEETKLGDDEHAAAARVSPLLRGGAWEGGFVPLEQTGIEAVGIATLHREAFGKAGPHFVLEKRKASRDALVDLAPQARFLHIATHGWFAPESVRSIADPEPLDKLMGFGSRMSGEERAKGMSPMLLCGLALAGANLPEDELGRAPGLITAEEISTLELSGCELAVLSACDTNVGERRAGQGVASLQKALHMAGARTVITSLWKVPDEATRELMLDFYRRIWIEKKPKGIALWEAKMKIRNEKDETGVPRYSTRDWAAWVLTGDPN